MKVFTFAHVLEEDVVFLFNTLPGTRYYQNLRITSQSSKSIVVKFNLPVFTQGEGPASIAYWRAETVSLSRYRFQWKSRHCDATGEDAFIYQQWLYALGLSPYARHNPFYQKMISRKKFRDENIRF